MTLITSDHDLGGFPIHAPISPNNPGKSRYCYLFPDLARQSNAGIFSDPYRDEKETIERLLAIALWIEQQNAEVDQHDLEMRIPLPAAYTYFAQFVNHDLSAPVGGMLQDVNAIPNASTIGNEQLFPGKRWRGDVLQILDHFQNEHERPLSLASLYGEGPFPANGHPPGAESRRLYDASGLHFRLGQTKDVSDTFPALTIHRPVTDIDRTAGEYDVLRQTDPGQPAQALIADARNDGNLILSQMHLALMRFHNKAIDLLRPNYPKPEDCFAAARLLVTRHYHWCILHDLLPQLLSKRVLEKMDFKAKSRLTTAEVPMEFTTAAYRFGHSMVADSYDYNANFGAEAFIAPSATLEDLFNFTTQMGMGGQGNYSQLPNHWVVDWDRLTDPQRMGLGRGDRIDMVFAPSMMRAVAKHDDGMGSIIARNLARGFHRRMAFGQLYAQAYKVRVLEEDEIRFAMPRHLRPDPAHQELADEKLKSLVKETPAWLYFLCEAKVFENGERLGPTASHIIADTFIGILQQNEDSILGTKGDAWTPQASPMKTAQRSAIVTLRDLLLFSAAPP